MRTLLAMSLVLITSDWSFAQNLPSLAGNLKLRGQLRTIWDFNCSKIDDEMLNNKEKEGTLREVLTREVVSIGFVSAGDSFICPIWGTNGRMNQFLVYAKDANARDGLVVIHPFSIRILTITAFDPEKLYFEFSEANVRKHGWFEINSALNGNF